MMKDTHRDRMLRAGFVVLVCILFTTILIFQHPSMSEDWEFWTTGRVKMAIPTPNALHNPMYAVVVGCIAAWGVLAIFLGRFRAGTVTMLLAALALDLYFRTTGRGGFSWLGILGLIVLFILNWLWKPWLLASKRDKGSA
jgi:hypothetical protein